MKKILLASAIALTSLPTFAQDLTFLYTNDIHAKVDPFVAPYIDKNRKVGGFANIAEYIKQQKSTQPNPLVLDAGDYFSGSTVDSLSQGEAIIDIMNQMDYDVATIGNHEFDYGWDNMLVQLSKANFNILQGNITYEDTNKLVWDNPYTIVERGGLKIGIIGLHGKFAFYDTVSAETRLNIEAKDEVALLKEYVATLAPQVDMTVLLVHEGTPARQSSLGSNDVRRALDKDIQLVKQVDGIDVLITGHAHVGTPDPIQVNDTLIVSTDAYGVNVGKLNLDFDPKTQTIRDYQFELKTIWDDEWEGDEQTQKVIDKWHQFVEKETQKVLAHTDVKLTRSYGESSELGNLTADAIMHRFPEAELAFTNSGGIRADIDQGDITLGDVIDALPFPNYPVAMTLSGKQILSLLEHAANLTNGVLQTSENVHYFYDTSKPKGQKITQATINGAPFDIDKTYRVATNNFLADGGDGFAEFTKGVDRENLENEYLFKTVQDYLGDASVLKKIHTQRIGETK